MELIRVERVELAIVYVLLILCACTAVVDFQRPKLIYSTADTVCAVTANDCTAKLGQRLRRRAGEGLPRWSAG
jgi:hypothetical protein